MSEMKRTTEAIGPDVETAISTGLGELQTDRDSVEIEILDEGSRGVFGLGAREARVRLTVKSQPTSRPTAEQPAPLAVKLEETETEPEPAPEGMEKDDAEISRGTLLELLTLMGIEDVQVEVRQVEPDPGEREMPLVLDIYGPDVTPLIGRRGETLAALQHIARLIVGQEVTGRVNLVLDVDGYKTKREQSLRQLAKRLAEQAIRTSRRVVLEPMPPHERRIIHMALREHPKVTTESIGEGNRRKVTIIPK